MDSNWLEQLHQSIDDYYDRHDGELSDEALQQILSDLAERHPDLDKQQILSAYQSLDEVSSGLPKLIDAFYDDQLLPPGTRLNQYRILDFIGEGGMGEVYLAERADGQFEQKYALKVLSKGWINNRVIHRFLQERQILAKLKHPNIATIHDAGVTKNKRPWFVLDYIEGRNIDTYCHDMNLSVEARVDLMVAVSQAVAYAHSQGIIHRDLKPGNILMVESADQVRPIILDFGVAAQIHDRQVTQTGDTLGTSGFMSPEQIQGQHPIDGRSDVFSLGIILYLLISHKHPFEAASDTETNYRILHDEPLSLSKGQVNPNLAAIIEKCLRKKPQNRYQSVHDLITDLQAYLGGESVTARPLSRPQKLANKLKKHPVRSVLGLLLLASLLGFSSLLIRQQIQAQKNTRAVQEYTLLSKNLEQRIRAQHLLPAHDLTPHYRAIESELVDLSSDLNPDELESGAIYASLGHTYQLLNQPKQSIAAFKKMQNSGFSTPQTEAQFGLALALAWEQEQARIAQLPDKEERATARQEAQNNYLEPAREKLTSATQVPSQNHYLNGYLAFLAKQYEQAVKSALQAYHQDNTRYETLRLAGWAKLHQGKDLAIQGDAESAMGAYQEAENYLQQSIEIARSDLKAHRYLCDLSEIKLHAFTISDQPLSETIFQQAADVCEQANRLMDDQLTVLINSQEIHTQWSNWLLDLEKPVYQVAKKSYELAQETYQLKPDDSDVLTGMVLSLIKLSEPDNPHLNQTEKAAMLNQARLYAEKSLEINEEDAYNWANLGDVEITRATRNYDNSDILPHIDEALQAYQKAHELLPSYAWQYMEGESYRVAADYLINNHRLDEAQTYLKKAKERYQTALEQTPEFATAWKNLATVLYEHIKIKHRQQAVTPSSPEFIELTDSLTKSCQLYQNKGGVPADLQPALSFYQSLSQSEIPACQ